jgi:hypothetical protein
MECVWSEERIGHEEGNHVAVGSSMFGYRRVFCERAGTARVSEVVARAPAPPRVSTAAALKKWPPQ